jgi:hypothetical protein
MCNAEFMSPRFHVHFYSPFSVSLMPSATVAPICKSYPVRVVSLADLDPPVQLELLAATDETESTARQDLRGPKAPKVFLANSSGAHEDMLVLSGR